MYNINWTTLIRETIPAVLRQSILVAFIMGMLSPFILLYNEFFTYMDQKRQHLQITGQVRILRHWLNELYDYQLRRITIEDAEDVDPLWIYLESENNPVYLPQFISSSSVDFIVNCPADIQQYEQDIISFLNTYKLVSKRYRIIFR